MSESVFGFTAADVSALSDASTLALGITGIIGNITSDLGPWAYGMLPATWRGLPFAVRESAIKRGRRIVVHEYPFRDDVWVEDLGRGVRRVAFRGFIVGDVLLLEQDAFILACEQPGPGTLLHPSLGLLQVALTDFTVTARSDLGRVLEMDFEFVETGSALFPSVLASTPDATNSASDAALSAIADDFGPDAADAISSGGAATASMAGTSGAWATQAMSLAADASLVGGVTAGIVGNFGRFGSGSRSALQATGETVATAMAGVSVAQSAVSRSGSAMQLVASAL